MSLYINLIYPIIQTNQIVGDLKKVVNAIDLILTNQHNDFLIQWEEGKTRQPKQCKDKLYAEIRYQISPYAIQEIHKHIKKAMDAKKKLCYYLLVPLLFEKQCNSRVRMSQLGSYIKINQFPLNIFIGIGDLRVVLVGTLVSPKRDNVCENIMLIQNQSQLLLLHLNIQVQQKIIEIFPPPRNFYEDEGNFNSKIYDSETDSSEHFLGYNDQSQNTPS